MNKTLCVLGFFFVALAAGDAACPRIVTRSEWGAKPASTSVLPTRPAPFAVIHHAAGSACTTQSACAQQVRNIQDFHMNGNGWDDIGYNFLIGEDGNIYEGRGWGKQGAHAPGYNSQSMGICFIGTFTSRLPIAAALDAAKNLIQCGVDINEIRSNYGLIGHRQATATECPGETLYNNVKTWPHYTANPFWHSISMSVLYYSYTIGS